MAFLVPLNICIGLRTWVFQRSQYGPSVVHMNFTLSVNSWKSEPIPSVHQNSHPNVSTVNHRRINKNLMQYLIYSQHNRGLPQTHQPQYKHQSKGQGWGSADKKRGIVFTQWHPKKHQRMVPVNLWSMCLPQQCATTPKVFGALAACNHQKEMRFMEQRPMHVLLLRIWQRMTIHLRKICVFSPIHILNTFFPFSFEP